MKMYENQAKRALEHIKKSSGFDEHILKEHFKISLSGLCKSISDIANKNRMNGLQAADFVIKLWDSSAPGYIAEQYPYAHEYDGRSFRFRPLEKEIIVLMHTGNGAFLHSLVNDGTDPNDVEYLNGLCRQAQEAYILKCKEMELNP